MNRLSSLDKSFEDVPIEVQNTFKSTLGTPRNDIERSYLQYKCQQYFRPRWIKLIYKCIAAIIAPFLLICFLLKKASLINKIDAISEFKGREEVEPLELKAEFSIDYEKWNSGFSITLHDLPFIYKILSVAPFDPYFFTKSLAKVASYSYLINCYKPNAIIVFAEYSFNSSMMTSFCERYGVEHINAMHGEKLYYIGYSFFRFHRCYVWDKYYEDLLLSLDATPGQFIVVTPASLRIDAIKDYDENCFADYKYYLQIYDEDKLVKILKSMEFVKQKGGSVIYRPHPRFSDMSLLEKYVDKEMIEYPKEVSIQKSVASSNCVVGYCSTVMYQAYLCGKTVILDDVAYKEGHQLLASCKYIMSEKDGVLKLSSFQN